MNRHLGEGTLQAMLDGELSPHQRAAAETHLGGCPACAAELRELRLVNERAAGLLARVDVPAPVAQAQMSMRARRMRSSRFGGWQQALLRAAILVLALAGVAAAAVPGSPVREWIATNVLPHQQPAAPPTLRPAPPPAPRPAPAAELASSGVSIRLEKGVMRVVLSGASPQLEIVAKLVDGDRASVIARGPVAQKARFRTSPGKIEVLDAGSGALEVHLPRGAGRASVEVNGRTYVAKQGESLVLLPPATAGGGPSVRVGG
ncbi:MAG TPA: zf-HC2 domain-containing protein [Longimicrobium sp.]|nr:zf-HC2 domain-containing protein [Longimicrobium sp.]